MPTLPDIPIRIRIHHIVIAILPMALLFSERGFAQTIWTGPTLVFEKVSNADWSLEENQDRISDSVWITRKDIMGIFNVAVENGYVNNVSPAGTEWAFGTTADTSSLTFAPWQTTVENDPPGMVGEDMVLHLIAEDIYIDIKFTNWQEGGAGGAFGYERSSNDEVLGTEELDNPDEIRVFPNPASTYIRIYDVIMPGKFTIFDVKGTKVCEFNIIGSDKIDIRDLAKGLYFLKMENGGTTRFVKE